MALTHPSIDYTGIPRVTAEGGGGDPMSVRASPDDFGGQVGGAAERAGQEGVQIADHYVQMATEAKANDAIANQWAPQSSQLRANFDNLRGQDKITGYDPYIQQLQKARQDFVSGASSPYEKQIREQWTTRHIAQEIDGARREQVGALHQFEDQSHADLIATQSQNAINNYNNPDIVKSTFSQIGGQVEKHGIDRGQSPDEIAANQQQARGTLATGLVNKALASKDVVTGHNILYDNKDSIPGSQQLYLSAGLHAEDISQHGDVASQSLMAGNGAPPYKGAAAQENRSLVANTAHDSGVDVNHALAVLRIESNDGLNTGDRGTLGQDKESAGLSKEEQAKTLCRNLQQAGDTASATLGHKAENWQGYLVYQQGAGGGNALLRADPGTRALDVLNQVYKDPKEALSAITDNGGSASMTVGQFTAFIQQKYNAAAGRTNTDIPAGQTPGAAMNAPLSARGTALQPGATPMQTLTSFDQSYPDMLNRANAIPNVEERAGVLRSLAQKREVYSSAASAWKQQFTQQAMQLSTNPAFTSMDQVPGDMRSALADDPMMTGYMERRAEYNLQKGSGASTKDAREYGEGFYSLFKAVHAADGAPDKVNSIQQLMQHVGKDGDLTMAGFDKLSSEMNSSKTPEGEAEGMMKRQFFALAKGQISGASDGLHIKDPKGDELYLRFMTQALGAYDKGKSEGKTPTQMFNPDSPDYLGKSIPSFKRPPSQWMGDMMYEGAAPGQRPLQDIIADVKAGKLTSEQGQGEAMKAGYIQAPATPTVPRPQ